MNHTNIKENSSVDNLILYFVGLLVVIVIIFIVLVIQIIKKNRVTPINFKPEIQEISPDV